MNLPDSPNPTMPVLIALLLALALTNSGQIRVDPSFKSPLPSETSIHALLSTPAGLLVGGSFVIGNNTNLTRFLPHGTIDSDFSTAIEGHLSALASLPHNRVALGGGFNRVGDIGVHNLAIVENSGTWAFQHSPSSSLNGRVHALLPLPDGRLLVGGEFSNVAGQNQPYLALFSSDGSLDKTFIHPLELSSAMEAGVTALARSSSGHLLIGGIFSIQGEPRTLVRLHPDGSLDPLFPAYSGPTLYLNQILVAPDDSLFLCGMRDAHASGFVRKLTRDGLSDSAFSEIVTDGPVNTILLHQSGKLFLGGDFDQVQDISRRNLACVEPGGTLDPSFNLPANGPILALASGDRGELYVAGRFSKIGETFTQSLARLVEIMQPQFAQISKKTGEFRTILSAEQGKSYLVEVSPDLVHWAQFSTNVASHAGLEILDGESALHSTRFFRARQLD